MGIPVLILGESGSGKTYSIKNFDAEEVGIFQSITDGLFSHLGGIFTIFCINRDRDGGGNSVFLAH